MQIKLFEETSHVSKEMLQETSSAVFERLRQVNFVSFSGGKDSTTVLQIVLTAIAAKPEAKLYIVTSDTMMEIPYFQTYVNLVKSRIRRYVNVLGINAEVITVKPRLQDSFWVSVIGKGYPAASMGFRWCTGRLKIEPITRFTKTVSAGKNYAVFVGVRSAESALRAKIYKQKDYKPNHYAPILDWSSHDVWEYLLTEPCPWGDGHADLVKVYKHSSDECVYGEAQGVCVGNARYGCWACPLQKSSQLDMIGKHTGDFRRYQELKIFKEALVEMASDRRCRSRIRRNGDEGVGPFLVEKRKIIYAALKRLEYATGWELITQEEEKYIHEHWETDATVHNTMAAVAAVEPLWECISAANCA